MKNYIVAVWCDIKLKVQYAISILRPGPEETDGKAVGALAVAKDIELGVIPSKSKLDQLQEYVDSADDELDNMSRKVRNYMRGELHSTRLRDIITRMHYHGVYILDDTDYRYVRNVLRINQDQVSSHVRDRLTQLIERKEQATLEI